MALALAISTKSYIINNDNTQIKSEYEDIASNCNDVLEPEEIIEIETKEEPVWEKYILTAYCPCMKCCGKTNGITATGTQATQGRTIAVDPNVIPYGTEVVIEGMGTYIAEDCGGAVKGNKIDVFFSTHEEAVKFGKQERNVWVKYKEE